MQTNFRFKPSEIGVFNTAHAAPAVAGLAKGETTIGLTMGQFSLIDIIHEILKKTGKADLYIATWSAGIKDAHQVRWMINSGMINGIRLLTDHSYVNRQRKYAASIEELFGAENIRCAEMHAKFVIIQNDKWDITITSSMNLNANKTCEVFTIHESAEITEFFMGYIRHHFDNLKDGWEKSSAVVSQCMQGFFAKQAAKQKKESGRDESDLLGEELRFPEFEPLTLNDWASEL